MFVVVVSKMEWAVRICSVKGCEYKQEKVLQLQQARGKAGGLMSHLLLVVVSGDDFLVGVPLPSLRPLGDAFFLVAPKTATKRVRKGKKDRIISSWCCPGGRGGGG